MLVYYNYWTGVSINRLDQGGGNQNSLYLANQVYINDLLEN